MADTTPESVPARQPLDVAQLVRCGLFCLLAWLVPGAGHFALGRRGRGVVFAILVAVALIVGCQLAGELPQILEKQPLTILSTLGAMGMGLPYFVLRYGVGYQGEILAAGYEFGRAFVLLAGLMNILLVLDTWDIATGRKE